MGGFHHLASLMPSFLDLFHLFDRESEYTFPLTPSSHLGGCAETHHGETCLSDISIDETSLHHDSYDETPYEKTSRGETFSDAIRHSTPDKIYWVVLPHGSSRFSLDCALIILEIKISSLFSPVNSISLFFLMPFRAPFFLLIALGLSCSEPCIKILILLSKDLHRFCHGL